METMLEHDSRLESCTVKFTGNGMVVNALMIYLEVSCASALLGC